jgi:Xaa-Pro aminopeptidase
MMTRPDQEKLARLLENAGETRPMSAIRNILEGLNAAPEDIADQMAWTKLIKTDDDPVAIDLLQRFRQHIRDADKERDRRYKYTDPLAQLRAKMEDAKIDAFIIPHSDEYMNEYLPACAERLAFITRSPVSEDDGRSGFTGSAGIAIAMKEKAAFFTDSRYLIQAPQQIDSRFDIYNAQMRPKDETGPDPSSLPRMKLTTWIEAHMRPGMRLGIDPWIHTPQEVRKFRDTVSAIGAELVLLGSPNLVDKVWLSRPVAPLSPVVPHPIEFSGAVSADKRYGLSLVIDHHDADALIITKPEEICWLLNVRGGDVPNTPLALSYAVFHRDGGVDWYIDSLKITDGLRDFLKKESSNGPGVTIYEPTAFDKGLANLAKKNKKIMCDSETCPARVEEIIQENGGRIVNQASPIKLMKARKNATEQQGMINAHLRDGVAMTRFLAELAQQDAPQSFDEISAAERLLDFRSENEHFRGLSFDTISGAGGNGAIVHYKSTKQTTQLLNAGPVYLLDSGAQYLDGTTDITRTIAVDTPNDEMKKMFTLVLMGHIDVAAAVFPEGTTGADIDLLARAPLKEKADAGYGHGTGHGVGCYLSVHEGPCGIGKNYTDPFEPGMVVSNEPGYYKEGEYGIRLENLIMVVETGKKDDKGRNLLAFKTLTLAPFDLNMVDPSLMEDRHVKWLNDYHADVRAKLLPELLQIDREAADFLKKSTEPIRKNGGLKPRTKTRLIL